MQSQHYTQKNQTNSNVCSIPNTAHSVPQRHTPPYSAPQRHTAPHKALQSPTTSFNAKITPTLRLKVSNRIRRYFDVSQGDSERQCFLHGLSASTMDVIKRPRISKTPPLNESAKGLRYEPPNGRLDYLLLRYSSMAFAATLPAPIAEMTVAAPVTASPPA